MSCDVFALVLLQGKEVRAQRYCTFRIVAMCVHTTLEINIRCFICLLHLAGKNGTFLSVLTAPSVRFCHHVKFLMEWSLMSIKCEFKHSRNFIMDESLDEIYSQRRDQNSNVMAGSVLFLLSSGKLVC